MTSGQRPKLITFDGEARSGKGTIAHYVKRSLQSQDINVMLTDRGQVFRVLVVAATKQQVDFDNASELDAFLSDQENLASVTRFVKDVYHMPHEERDALLYTKEVGENSAKMGGRPLAQDFSISLMEKWFRDAGDEGIEVILLDGRSLEKKGVNLEAQGLCEYVLGLYFICDPVVGARRTLGYADKTFDELSDSEKEQVNDLVRQIFERNKADMTRDVQRLERPDEALAVTLPDVPVVTDGVSRPMYVIDTSAEMTKDQMCEPIARLIDVVLARR